MSDSNSKNQQSGIIELDFDFNEVQVVSETFFKEADEILLNLDEHVLKLESRPYDELLLQALFRKIHTLKGGVGAVPGGQLFSSLAHEFETLLDRLRKQKIAPDKECIEIFLQSSKLLKILAENLRLVKEIYPEALSEVIELISRYGTKQLSPGKFSLEALASMPTESAEARDGVWLSQEQMSSLLELSSEFIILKNAFHGLDGREEHHREKFLRKQNEISHSLNSLSDQLQSILEKAQKVPLKTAFANLATVVRQSAYELHKEVQLIDSGFSLQVDKILAQDLGKALTHMVRNAVDHGLEVPEEREKLGKSRQGSLEIKVEERNSVIHCAFRDDGRGLDRERILKKALEKGLTNPLEAGRMNDEAIYNFIFHPGFSTKEKITTISGRGVGMDVVQTTVQKYGGHIKIQSFPGQGVRFEIQVPIPRKLLVERSLLCRWQQISLAVPLSAVLHITSCEALTLTEVDTLRFCQFNQKTVPLLNLLELREKRTRESAEKIKASSAIFIATEAEVLGLVVDKIEEQIDLVIKPTSEILSRIPGFKGNSVLSDESICYVTDPVQLLRLLKSEVAS